VLRSPRDRDPIRSSSGTRSSVAARDAAERRWNDELFHRYRDEPAVYSKIVEAVDTKLVTATTEVEVCRRGAGMAYLMESCSRGMPCLVDVAMTEWNRNRHQRKRVPDVRSKEGHGPRGWSNLGDPCVPDRTYLVQALLAGVAPQLMVTDPPYGVDYDPEWRHRRGVNNSARRGKIKNDEHADWTAAWKLFPGQIAYVWHGRCAQRSLLIVSPTGASRSELRLFGRRNDW
jgi:hypothetical protein